MTGRPKSRKIRKSKEKRKRADNANAENINPENYNAQRWKTLSQVPKPTEIEKKRGAAETLLFIHKK